MVITKGADRYRYLRDLHDAMPGKQMSGDAEMQNGMITETKAPRSVKLQKQADFMVRWMVQVSSLEVML